MNFVAIACDNLGIPTPIGNNVWTRISNPNLIEHEAISRIEVALEVIGKQDHAVLEWLGNNSINFTAMHNNGVLR